jgi:Secretory lipase
VPLPSADPFYSVPAWQVKHKTTDDQGDASADVSTVLVPDVPWTGTAARPLVSYQTAEDGISTACAPSYGLRAGVTDAENNSGAETGVMEYALLQGLAVVAPDYEGPNSEFLAPRRRGPRRPRRDQGCTSFRPGRLQRADAARDVGVFRRS